MWVTEGCSGEFYVCHIGGGFDLLATPCVIYTSLHTILYIKVLQELTVSILLLRNTCINLEN